MTIPHLEKNKKIFLASGGRFEKVKLRDFFEVKSNPQLDKDSFVFTTKCQYPYFTRTVNNNGVLGYVEFLDKRHLNPGKTIAVGMMGMQFFYMEKEYYAGQFTKRLEPLFKGINQYIAQWFIAWLNKSSEIYKGVLVRDFETTVSNTIIDIPYDKDGSVAFHYMESYIRILELERLAEMNKFLKSLELGNPKLLENEYNELVCKKNTQYKAFRIGDLYEKVEIKNNKFDKRKDTRQSPNNIYSVPLVNAKHGNNGIMYYGKSDIFDAVEMTIDIVQNGAIATGDVYPQPQLTGVLWDAYLIRAIQHKDTVESLLYISTVIEKTIKKKYTYDNKAYWSLVKDDMIYLPITSKGEIDCDYMKTFIRWHEYLTVQKILGVYDEVQ